jgi:hypothetical protein
MPRYVPLFGLVVVFIAVSLYLWAGSAISFDSHYKGAPPQLGGPITTVPPTPVDPFEQVQTNLKQLVQSTSQWRTPPSLDVEKTTTVGLQIGDSPDLRKTIARTLPGTESTEAGPVMVGPTVSVRLMANPDEAEITPKEAIVQSTTRDVAMVFSWIVRPKIVTNELHLVAQVEVPLGNGSQKTSVELPRTIKVNRTLAYTASQLFSSWATWVAIVTAVVSGVMASFRRTRKWLAWPVRALKNKFWKEEGQKENQPDEHDRAGYL